MLLLITLQPKLACLFVMQTITDGNSAYAHQLCGNWKRGEGYSVYIHSTSTLISKLLASPMQITNTDQYVNFAEYSIYCKDISVLLIFRDSPNRRSSQSKTI